MTDNNYKKPEDLKRSKFILETITSYVKTKGKILDIGCGTGIMTRLIGKIGFDVTGVDSDPMSIEFAKSGNSQNNVKFLKIDINDYNCEIADFDAVICSEVLEHLPNPGYIIQLVFKMLKPDGLFIVTVPNGKGPRELFVTRPVLWLRENNGLIWNWLIKVKQVFGYNGLTIQSKAENLDHIQFFSLKQLHQMAENHGFKIMKTAKTNFISGVFPISLISRYSTHLQVFDCWLADKLPYNLSSGFLTVWIKNEENGTVYS